jgi:hypothetical protein
MIHARQLPTDIRQRVVMAQITFLNRWDVGSRLFRRFHFGCAAMAGGTACWRAFEDSMDVAGFAIELLVGAAQGKSCRQMVESGSGIGINIGGAGKLQNCPEQQG